MKLSLFHSTMQESAADFKGKWLRVRGSYNRRWGRRRSNRTAGKEGDFVSVFLSYAQRHSWSEVRAIRQTNLSRVRVCIFVIQTCVRTFFLFTTRPYEGREKQSENILFCSVPTRIVTHTEMQT